LKKDEMRGELSYRKRCEIDANHNLKKWNERVTGRSKLEWQYHFDISHKIRGIASPIAAYSPSASQ
jgi:hypothetical protein